MNGDKPGNLLRKTARLLALSLYCYGCVLFPGRAIAVSLGTAGEKPSGAASQGRLFKTENMAIYVVKEKDRLAELANRFYGDPDKGWLILQANDLEVLEPGQVLILPLRPTNPGGLSPHGYQVVPVLLYHHFSTNCRTALCMPVTEFSQQMAYLKREGYHTVTMGQVLRFINYEEPLPPKAVAITIDDGYRSVYDLVYPELKKHGYKATLFIYTDFIDNSPNALTWEQLRELSAAGFEVEAHSISHADLTRRNKGESQRAYLRRIKEEVEVPRKIIHKHLGQEVNLLAYPYGRFNDLVISMTKEAGYLGAVSVIRGENPFFTDPYRIKRTQILNSVKAPAFETLLKTFHPEKLQ
jgi:peptidoglycan/xylan/chitin deacetylase (PgdA/CDA1 family)